MAYSAEISRTNPSCFLFLIDQSGSMSDSFAGTPKRKADGVADAINKLLQNLVIKCSKSEGVRDYYEVGVIGYGANVGSAFSGALAGKSLALISEVANSPARIEDRMQRVEDGAGGTVNEAKKMPVWFEPVASNGTPMAEAMRLAHQLLQDWVSRHQASYPPIVINITDGETSDPSSEAQNITNLSTSDGNVLLFNCHISDKAASPIVFPDSEAALPDQYAQLLFGMSSILPSNLCDAARSEGIVVGQQARGFAFNADLVELIRFIDIGTRPSNLR